MLKTFAIAAALACAGCHQETAIATLERMPSPSQMWSAGMLWEPGTVDDDLSGVNRALALVSALDVPSQRRAVLAYVAECRDWLATHSKGARAEWWERSDYRFDCGKLDFLALAGGRKPALYRTLAYFSKRSGSIAVEVDRKINVPSVYSGPPPIGPILDGGLVRKAAELAAKGYFDLRVGP